MDDTSANPEDVETATAGMTDMQKRLFEVRMRMNQGRKVNKKEVENEYKRFSDPKFEGKQRYQEKLEELKKAQIKANKGIEIGKEVGEIRNDGGEIVVGAGGVVGDDPIMLITAAAAERMHEKAMIKEKNIQTFGLQAQCSDATYKSYKKQLAKLPSSSSSSKAGGASGPVDKEAQFTIGMKYGQGPAVSKAGIDRLSKDIVDHQEDRKKLSRRRMTAESDDVDFINDKNEAFNKKIKRSFDKYTVEIRQNLERGTAI